MIHQRFFLEINVARFAHKNETFLVVFKPLCILINGRLFCRSAFEEMLQPVDLNLINDLWVPNVFIYNLKTFKVKGQKNRFIVKRCKATI